MVVAEPDQSLGADQVKPVENFSSSSSDKKRKQHGKSKKKRSGKEGKAMKSYRLVHFSELPEYMKDNQYILRYYRSDWPLSRAFLSLFTIHNETLNIWTHLLGFLLFLGLTIMHLDGVPKLSEIISHLPWSISTGSSGNVSCSNGNFSNGVASLIKLGTSMSSELLPDHHSSPPTARWPFFVFLAGSMFCLLTSSICHLFCCHSHRLNIFLSRLDYIGIAVMIVASFFPPIYYIFQCDHRWQITYLASITIMGLFTVLNLLSPHLSTGACRTYRAMLFVAMGLSGVIPAVHATAVNWNESRRPVTLAYEIAMAMSYLTGTFFYVSRIPERWKPGWFDLTGHSHQIFHLFVIGGALAHYGAALIFLEWRDTVAC